MMRRINEYYVKPAFYRRNVKILIIYFYIPGISLRLLMLFRGIFTLNVLYCELLLLSTHRAAVSTQINTHYINE